MRGRKYFVLYTGAAIAVAVIVACTGEDPDFIPPKDDASAADGPPPVDGAIPVDGSTSNDAGGDTGNPSGRSVACGIAKCTGTQVCCRANDPDAAACVNPGECPSNVGSVLECDDPTDCKQGLRCCGGTITEDGGPSDKYFLFSSCTPTDPDAGCGALEFCRSGAGSTDCFRQSQCIPTQPNYFPPMHVCQ